ncbi:hypothetical protein F5Y07DRAFT_361885 [Xylaria sp. FL0933]|nr:hypothetical protein F5Y07DRAFT_361885 [Xylaria sp. FL0933]
MRSSSSCIRACKATSLLASLVICSLALLSSSSLSLTSAFKHLMSLSEHLFAFTNQSILLHVATAFLSCIDLSLRYSACMWRSACCQWAVFSSERCSASFALEVSARSSLTCLRADLSWLSLDARSVFA